MRIEIEIPKEFEKHFNQDKFKDSLERIMVDIWNLLENKNCLCAGNYEYETIKMLEKAFENSESAYDVDKVIKELELHSFELGTDTIPVHYVRLNEAIEIVKQGGDANGVCKWKKYPFDWFTGCDGYKISHKQGDYCPRCGKRIKIKVVE